jgi:UDP-N-acetylmuramoylalanine--D-glutamate ligase
MVKASGQETFVGGNLGTPLCDAVDLPAAREGGALVIELSSYQLERTYTLRPRVAVLINLTPDHLDRYDSLASYGAAKQRLFYNQTHEDHAVVPGDDPVVCAMVRAWGGQCHTWGTVDSDVRLAKGSILDKTGEGFPLELLRIRGAHNVQNAMAAVLAARLFGASTRGIRQALSTFEGLPHRMQWVLEDDGIAYFDDSKATNVGAAVKALEGIDRKVVLIAGGRDKGGSYEPMKPMLHEKGRALVLLGEAADMMQGTLGSTVPTRIADDMFDAVRMARDLARRGDAVLLAPACSSLDMFENYAERGTVFAAAVRAMAGTPRQEDDLDMAVDVEVDDG